jgi:uncharacterized protein (TIGR03435 family)
MAILFVGLRRLLPVTALWMIVTAPLSGQTSGSRAELPAKFHEFEVVSVKPSKSGAAFFRIQFTPDGVRIENASLLMIIRAAYGLFNSLDDKFLGVPGWAKTERFDVEAKVGPADVDEYKKLSMEQRQHMMQAVLADRFALQAHRETKEQPVYLLVIGKNGSKLAEAKPGEGNEAGGSMKRSRDQLEGTGVLMSQVVSALTQTEGRTVIDKTGLAGRYDFTLRWMPDEDGAPMLKAADSGQPANEAVPVSSGSSIFTAVQEQLGLRLEAAKGPVECQVVDHVEQPSEN